MDLGRFHIQQVHVCARKRGGVGGGRDVALQVESMADLVVPGCAAFHDEAGEHGSTKRAQLEAEIGIDLVQEALRLAAEWKAGRPPASA